MQDFIQASMRWAKIRGRKLDLYIANEAEARQFGEQSVKVKVLKPAELAK
jgi:3D (Asp-Asp-Asp) domain-containing protein